MNGKLFDRLAAALTARAERIARTRRNVRRNARRNADRWRSAPYLWPLFAN